MLGGTGARRECAVGVRGERLGGRAVGSRMEGVGEAQEEGLWAAGWRRREGHKTMELSASQT